MARVALSRIADIRAFIEVAEEDEYLAQGYRKPSADRLGIKPGRKGWRQRQGRGFGRRSRDGRGMFMLSLDSSICYGHTVRLLNM
jgi:hypothetical protein